MDANHFLGDYWLSEDEFDKALLCLEQADKAAIRPVTDYPTRKPKGQSTKP